MYYSQFGEDEFLDKHCQLPEKGVFVDVGAGGIENSNSYYFEQKGWQCLCIEPDKRHIGLDKRKLVDNRVVGDEEKEVDFVYHHEPSLSGLHHHNKSVSVSLPMFKLDTILANYDIKKIDILSIDTEGNELAVLKGFSIDKYEPKYIIIEYKSWAVGDQENQICQLLKGYRVVHKTPANLIMEKEVEKC